MEDMREVALILYTLYESRGEEEMTNKEAAYILSDRCHDYTCEELRTAFDLAIKALEEIDSLKNERPHGDWLWTGFHDDSVKWSCSLCGGVVTHQVSICPNCKAKMQLWY